MLSDDAAIMLSACAKNEKGDLSEADRRTIKDLLKEFRS
jgi:hypothetical protein